MKLATYNQKMYIAKLLTMVKKFDPDYEILEYKTLHQAQQRITTLLKMLKKYEHNDTN